VRRVWYVAYGSNMGLDRFRCYLAGGTPAGGLREYVGCRDPRDHADSAGLRVPGGLVFAGRSTVWGGGMAFYDGTGSGQVASRAYLVTEEQFADVVAQEMRRPPGGDFAQELVEVLPDVESAHVMGSGRYETITRLGRRDGWPMFTATHEDVASIELAAPTAAYLRWISTGLGEAHGWDGARIAGYLAAAGGVTSTWSYDELASIARGSVD
jgi:hypothetical protein